MKVCTDACLFGAYLADWFNENGKVAEQTAIDIGTGTGLLSLMLAQKTQLCIEALEIDPAAAKQATENFLASPWKDRLTLFQGDALDYPTEKKYGLIFSNPPFFEADLRSPDSGKNAAKHDTGLTLEQLAGLVDRWLAPDGNFAVLLPYHRVDPFIKIAAGVDLHLQKLTLVKHTKAHPFFRGMLVLGRKKQAAEKTEMVIKEAQVYSTHFTELLQDYYLHL